MPTPLEYFNAIKMSAEALKAAFEFNNQVEINLKYSEFIEKINNLHSAILDLNEQKSKLIQEKAEIEKKLMKLENWEQEKSKYILYEIDSEVFVYAYKKSENNIDPMHYCCKKCMNEGKKSVLDLSSEHSDGSKHYFCQSCNKTISTHKKREVNFYPSKSSWMG